MVDVQKHESHPESVPPSRFDGQFLQRGGRKTLASFGAGA